MLRAGLHEFELAGHQDGRVQSFVSAPVGELFALLRQLQRSMSYSQRAAARPVVPVNLEDADEAVLAHARALPISARIDLRESKKPIRRLAERRFGSRYAHAPKSGFGVPLDAWLRGDGPFARLAARLLGDGRAHARGLFDAERATRLLAQHRSATRDCTELLWGLVNLELWARVCLDGEGPSSALEAA